MVLFIEVNYMVMVNHLIIFFTQIALVSVC